MKNKILVYEDYPNDFLLIKRKLSLCKDKVELIHAENKTSFMNALHNHNISLILADYNIPDFSGLEALQYAFEYYPYIPFVFVTGTINDEELAAQTILKGASDYVLKNNLKRLPTIVSKLLSSFARKEDNLIRLFNQIKNNEASLDRLNELLEKLERMEESLDRIKDESNK